jgi:hypothetical protein
MPLTLPKPKLKWPTFRDKESVESEFGPEDIDALPPVLTEHEKRLVALVDDRFRQAADARRVHEGVWFESLAFYLSNQWVEWSAGRSSLKSLRDPNNPYKIYTSHNKIKSKIKKLLSRIVDSKPDASVQPLTDTEVDKKAAAEARALLNHLDRKFNRQQQIKQLSKYALTTTTAMLKIWFDPTAVVDVPRYDKQGNLIGSTESDVGDICETIVPFAEIYPDPKGKTWGECGWLIHAKLQSLEYIRDHYPDGGQWVEGEANGGIAGIVETRLASVVGDYQRDGTESGKNAVIVKEMWDKNGTREFPDGRLITVANGRLLREEAWLYKYWKEFPFIPFEYEQGLSSVWGLNAVGDLLNPQRDYNRTLSRIQEHVRTAWGKILAPVGCEIGPNAFNSARPNEVVYYNVSVGIPQHIPAPALPPFLLESLRIDDSDMQDASGIHDVSNGSVPPGVTAGNAIELLQESDQTQMADPKGNLEVSNIMRAQCEIAIARQFYTEPRLIAIQDTKSSPIQQQEVTPPGSPPANPLDAAAMEAMTFTNLASGRVAVVPGSSTAKSPAARIQQLMDMASKGMFQLENLPTTIMILDQMGLERSDDLIDRLKTALQFMIAQAQQNKPDPAMLAQQQAEAQARMQQAQHEHDAEIQGYKDRETELNARLKMDHDAEFEAVQHRNTMELETLRASLEVQKLQAERSMPPAIAPISVSADPTATVNIEKEAGIDGKVPATPTTKPAQASQSTPGEKP